MQNRTSPRVRILAIVLIFILWLPALVLGAETYERVRTAVGLRLFPTMLNLRNAEPFGMWFADPKPSVDPPTPSVTLAASARSQPPMPQPDVDGVDRAVIATVHGEMFMRVHDDGTVLEAWGEPAIEIHLRRQLDLTRNYPDRQYAAYFFMGRQQPTEVDIEFFFATIWRHYTLTITPDLPAHERTIFAIDRTPGMPDNALDQGEHPPDSPWRVGLYAYKPHTPMGYRDDISNNFGFRDRDIATPKPPGVFRIVCLGGSTTMEGRTMDTSYPKHLERLLRERFGEHVEVVNAGIIGNTTFNIHTRLDEYLEMEPDIFLFYGGVNDISHHFQPIWLELRDADTRRWERSYLLRRIYNRQFLPPDDFLRDFLRRSTLRNLAAIRYRTQQAGAEFVVCSFSYFDPNRLRWRDRLFLDANLTAAWGGEGLVNYFTWCNTMALYNDELEKWSAAEGVPFLPVAADFRGGHKYFSDPCHATDRGIEVKAQVIARHLGEYLVQRPEFR